MSGTKSNSNKKTSKFQKFEVVRVHRSQLKNAPYNPRKMDDTEKTRLRKVIKSRGLISTITWNERTGNIVGGHRRIECLDILEKTEDYYLDVARVDVDDAEEVNMNMMLNNASITGQFDTDIIKEISKDMDIDFSGIGFTDIDLDLMFDGEFQKKLEDTEEVVAAKSTIDEIKEHRKGADEKFKEANSAEFFFTVVCESEAEKVELMGKVNAQPYDKFIMSSQFRDALIDGKISNT